MGGKMKVLSKVQVLAQRNGWSIARAQGFVDGEMSRRRGAPPSTYARVGIDEYCLGFRAGYYERGASRSKGAVTQTQLKDIAPVAAAANGAASAESPTFSELQSTGAAGAG